VPFRKQIVRALAFTLVALQVSGASDLSPGKWKPADRDRVEKLEMRFFPAETRAIEGNSGLISNTGSPIAVTPVLRR